MRLPVHGDRTGIDDDGSDDRVEVGVENEGSLSSRRTGYCWYGSMESACKYCVLAGFDAVVVGVDSKFLEVEVVHQLVMAAAKSLASTDRGQSGC